jgi:hypothetical protein
LGVFVCPLPIPGRLEHAYQCAVDNSPDDHLVRDAAGLRGPAFGTVDALSVFAVIRHRSARPIGSQALRIP